MKTFNLKNKLSLEASYLAGLLPQRNQAGLFYQDEYSSRSNLAHFSLSSENKRILKKTSSFTYQTIALSQFQFTPAVKKQIFKWIKALNWDFPIASVKTLFTNHLFNYLYIWKNSQKQTCAYSLCLFDSHFSHIAYVFYDPQYARQDLPIRLSLQVIEDSYRQKLNYCYLGRFNPDSKLGFYKRNFPGFEYFAHGAWIPYN